MDTICGEGVDLFSSNPVVDVPSSVSTDIPTMFIISTWDNVVLPGCSKVYRNRFALIKLGCQIKHTQLC